MYNAQCYISEAVTKCQTERYTVAVEPERKSAQFMIRMRPSVKSAGENAARDENRSLASLMETLLIEHLKERGYLTAGKGRKR